MHFLRRLPLHDLEDYRPAYLPRDLLAGVAVTFLAVPQGVAYAMIAGLPPAMGLYATTVPTIVGSLLRSSRHVIAGPTNALSLLVGAAVVGAAGGDPMTVAATLALMVGVMQVVASLLGVGGMVSFISSPVVLGYITGAGVLIGIGQLHNITATTGLRSDQVWETIGGWLAVVGDANPLAVTVAMSTAGLMVFLRLVNKKIPGAIVVMAVAIAANLILDLEARGLRTIADLAPIPAGLPPISLPDLALIQSLLPAAAACTVLSLVESSAVARSIASRTGQRLQPSMEFFGQGMANIAAAFFSGYPASGSLSRSAINAQLGAHSRLAGMISGLLMLVVLALLSPLLDHTPIAALAGLLLIIAWDLVDVQRIQQVIRTRRADSAAFLVTLASTWIIPLDKAIYVGVAISLVLFLRRAKLLTVRQMVFGPRGRLRELPIGPLPPRFRECTAVRILHVEGSLFFASAGELRAALEDAARSPEVEVVIVRLKRTSGMDVTTTDVLEAVAATMAARGQHLLLVGMRDQAMATLQRSGAADTIGASALFPTKKRWFAAMNEAIERAAELLSPAHCHQECPLADYIAFHRARREAEQRMSGTREE